MNIPKIINKAELARLMYPENKSAPQLLADKLNGRQGKRITKIDQDKIKEAIRKMLVTFLE